MNLIVHYIVPIAMVSGWLAFGPRPRVSPATVALAALSPVLWLAYTLLRGAIWKWYPYPFLNVSAHGYARVAINALLVTVVLGVVAALFAVGDRGWRPPRGSAVGPCRRLPPGPGLPS